MVGLVPHRDVPRYMKSATLAAFPFIWRAGAGNVVFEAMAMELPVVISEANETIEELVRAKCVVGVSPCDEEALANGILRLLNDIDLRRSYGATGRRYVQENLSDSQITSIWFTLIHTVRELVHQHSIPGTASS
jgi:glycosyltransferase involved in cell wall biosynthesis